VRGLIAATAVAVPWQLAGLMRARSRRRRGRRCPAGLLAESRRAGKIRAAALEVREKDKQATFTGDVHVLQGDTEMRCKLLTVFYEEETGTRNVKAAEPGPGGDKQIRRIEAKGSVVVVQKDQNAAGDAAIFNMRENTVTLTATSWSRARGHPAGQRLVVDLTPACPRWTRPGGGIVSIRSAKHASRRAHAPRRMTQVWTAGCHRRGVHRRTRSVHGPARQDA